MPQAIATGFPPSAFPGVPGLAAAPIQRLPADYISDFKLARTHSEQLASYATAQKDAEAAALKAKEGEETAKNEANFAREDCKLLNLKLITIAEKASEQERVLKKECTSAKDRATELDNHTKRLQALYDQTRDKVSSYEASLKVEKDKIIQLEGQNLALQNKNQALEASAVPREPGNRVTILHVAWAGECLMDYVQRPHDPNENWIKAKLLELATNKQQFMVCREFFGNRDPLPGMKKTCTITYRYDAGRIRWLNAKEYDTVQFEPW